MRFAVLAATLLFACSAAQSQSQTQQSRIEANVPSDASLGEFLNRDLLLYFRTNGASAATSVEHRLLRNAPTQSGVAYPKYYAWVQVQSPTGRIAEGAVRVAAIDRVRFEVTDFIPKSRARGNRELLESVFPRALVPSILQLAAE